MRAVMRTLRTSFLALAVASLLLRADPGDVESSHDYPGFTRLPGFVITDYVEDNPASFDFPVARPLPIDANHVETVHVQGHRYVIRYELNTDGKQPSLLQMQQAYEKMAAAAGFTAEKTGAVGDVNETFHQAKGGHDVWVYLEPSMTIAILTIVESSAAVPPPAVIAPPAAIAPPPPVPEDSLYTALGKRGRVTLPLTFLPGKPDLDADSQPVIDRVVAILQRHPDLFLRIEGHTDDAGDPQDNQRLSAQRAVTVRAMLIAGHIDKNRLTTAGLGGSQPVAGNMTAEGREKNRRIELVVVRKDATMPPTSNPVPIITFPETDDHPPPFHSPAPDGKNYYPNTSNSSQ